jgi:hypothetical protein
MKVLRTAIENGRLDLAAYALVLALVKVSKNGKQPADVKEAKPKETSQVLC